MKLVREPGDQIFLKQELTHVQKTFFYVDVFLSRCLRKEEIILFAILFRLLGRYYPMLWHIHLVTH